MWMSSDFWLVFCYPRRWHLLWLCDGMARTKRIRDTVEKVSYILPQGREENRIEAKQMSFQDVTGLWSLTPNLLDGTHTTESVSLPKQAHSYAEQS